MKTSVTRAVGLLLLVGCGARPEDQALLTGMVSGVLESEGPVTLTLSKITSACSLSASNLDMFDSREHILRESTQSRSDFEFQLFRFETVSLSESAQCLKLTVEQSMSMSVLLFGSASADIVLPVIPLWHETPTIVDSALGGAVVGLPTTTPVLVADIGQRIAPAKSAEKGFLELEFSSGGYTAWRAGVSSRPPLVSAEAIGEFPETSLRAVQLSVARVSAGLPAETAMGMSVEVQVAIEAATPPILIAAEAFLPRSRGSQCLVLGSLRDTCEITDGFLVPRRYQPHTAVWTHLAELHLAAPVVPRKIVLRGYSAAVLYHPFIVEGRMANGDWVALGMLSGANFVPDGHLGISYAELSGALYSETELDSPGVSVTAVRLRSAVEMEGAVMMQELSVFE